MVIALEYDGVGATKTYSMTLRVSDTGSNNFDIPFVVTVTNFNDAGPAFSPTTDTVSVSETDGVDSLVYTYAATDADDAPFDVVLYEIITCKYVRS